MLPQITITRFSAARSFAFLLLFLTSAFVSQAQQQPVTWPAGKSGFIAKLINIEAATSETFRYSTTLHNGSASARIYELKTDLPFGWTIAYKVDGSQVTSINMDAGKTQDIAIEINATATASPKKYKIPIKAVSGSDTLSLNLEAVVKGSYSLALSTPTGRLSDEVTSGSQKELQLTVKNTGTLPLNDLQVTAQLPTGWESTFEPANIKQLEAGKTIDVKATVKVPDKTIAGDYAANFTATNSNTNSQVAFRLAVKTSLLSGWIGVLVILLAVGIVYYLIRKYGRR
ncbi:NEW3 domain-containing protein [Mucilaginibacter sp. SP1R1]|uniref:COG1470 family protein n=1 Tax=Mucilaginibacter sp. SP1R1 TaxID=2723091 RepID=UPI00161A8D3F|nr:NEW3 domain-containing protein [Mucilaginibacter sp. SP1R1]MBB6151794.1 putative membrane protein [Mucilaginibacter sp. SP1R1]